MKRSRESHIREPYLLNRLTGDNLGEVEGISHSSTPVPSTILRMKRSRENQTREVKRLTGDNRGEGGGISYPPTPVPALPTAPGHARGAGETPPVTAEYTREYLNLVKATFKDNTCIHGEFIEILTDFRAGRIHGSLAAMKMKELFKGGPELPLGFNAFLSKEDITSLSPAEEQHKHFKGKQPANFEETSINKVNEKFRISKEKIRSMRYVKPSRNGEKTSTFGERNPGVDENRPGDCSQKRTPSKVEKDQMKSIENENNKEYDPQLREKGKASKQAGGFMETKLLSEQGVSNKENPVQLVGKLRPQAGDRRGAVHRPFKEIIPKKLVSDFNPSYRLRPNSYPKILSTHCTELSRRILNDSSECVRPGSGRYEEKPKNQDEENSFVCEDARYELDILVERTTATAERVAELVDVIQDPKFKQQMSTFALEEHLSTINLRCIETIYGDHGSEVVDSLRVNAENGLPVVLLRLKQKIDEWSRYRVEMNRAMREVYSKTHN